MKKSKTKTQTNNQTGETSQAEHSFLGIFGYIDEEAMVIDSEFQIVDVNNPFLERIGLTRAEVVGKKCYEVKERSGIPCRLREKLCPLEKARETGKRTEMIQYPESGAKQLREQFVIMYPIKLEKIDRQAAYFVEITRDVTEYRHIIKELQASERKFRAILDTAVDAIIRFDEDNKIILFNNAAQSIFGFTRREVIGKDLDFLIPAQQENRTLLFEEKDSRTIGKTLSLTGRRKNGELFPIDLSLSFLEQDGGVTFTGIIRDVSEQYRLKRKLLQSERLAAVGQAVAHVAHEIRNPLMIMGGLTSQIRKNIEDEQDLQKLDMVLEEVNRLENLVANLSDITKEYRLIVRPIDINAVIRDVLNIMEGVHPPEKYSFNQDLRSEVREIKCDPEKLKQVFMNVISNGLEAMSDGGSITISSDSIPGGVEIRIQDEGIGIPEENLRNIFEPFFTTRKTGSGLGLSISYKIIEAHKGDILAFSRPGQGTTFIIRLPKNPNEGMPSF